MNCGHLEKLPWCLWVCVFVSSVPHVPPGTPGNNTSHEQWSFLAAPSPQSQLCSWTPVQISAPPSSPLTGASVYYLIWLSGPQRSLEKDPGQNRIACTVRGWEIFSDLGSRSESHKYREVSLVSKTATRSNWRGQSGGADVTTFHVCLSLSLSLSCSLMAVFLSFLFPEFPEFVLQCKETQAQKV